MLDKIMTVEAVDKPIDVAVFKITDTWRNNYNQLAAKTNTLPLVIDGKQYDVSAEFSFHVLPNHATKPLSIASVQDFDVTCDISGDCCSVYVTENAKAHILKFILDNLHYHYVSQYTFLDQNKPYPVEIYEISISDGDTDEMSQTHSNIQQWVKRTTTRITNHLGDENLQAVISPCRRDSSQMIKVLIENNLALFSCEIVFVLNHPHDYGLNSNDNWINVPDALEALHMIGLLTSTLNITVKHIGD